MEDGGKMKKAFSPEIAKEVKINKINEQEKLLLHNQPEVSCLGVEGERKKRTMWTNERAKVLLLLLLITLFLRNFLNSQK